MGVRCNPIHSPVCFMPKVAEYTLQKSHCLQTAKCKVQSATICWTKVATPIPPRDVNCPSTPSSSTPNTHASGTAPDILQIHAAVAHPPNLGRFLDWPTMGCLPIQRLATSQSRQTSSVARRLLTLEQPRRSWAQVLLAYLARGATPSSSFLLTTEPPLCHSSALYFIMAKDWTPVHEEIRRLYEEEGKPLHEVMRLVRGKFGFIAS